MQAPAKDSRAGVSLAAEPAEDRRGDEGVPPQEQGRARPLQEQAGGASGAGCREADCHAGTSKEVGASAGGGSLAIGARSHKPAVAAAAGSAGLDTDTQEDAQA
eukprot:6123466-Alexandrium_andersonii.AAC.1